MPAACLRRRNQNAIPAASAPIPTIPAATPIPAFAPTDSVSSSSDDTSSVGVASDEVEDKLGRLLTAPVAERLASDEVDVAVGFTDVVLKPNVFYLCPDIVSKWDSRAP